MASTEQRTGFRFGWGSKSDSDKAGEQEPTNEAPVDEGQVAHPEAAAQQAAPTSAETATTTEQPTAAGGDGPDAGQPARENLDTNRQADPTHVAEPADAESGVEDAGVTLQTVSAAAPSWDTAPAQSESAAQQPGPDAFNSWDAPPSGATWDTPGAATAQPDAGYGSPAPNTTDPWGTAAATPAPTAPAPSSTPPTAFLGELMRAMQTAAEQNRRQVMDRFHADGTAFLEQVRTRSTDEADELRKLADEDINGIHAWSKAEIARIQAETEERVANRKSELERHLEDHTQLVDKEIQKVEARMAAFEQQMDAFFTRLNEVTDPTAFAAVAHEMPTPPAMDAIGSEARAAAVAELERPLPIVAPHVPVAASQGESQAASSAAPSAGAASPTATEPTAAWTAASTPKPSAPSTSTSPDVGGEGLVYGAPSSIAAEAWTQPDSTQQVAESTPWQDQSATAGSWQDASSDASTATGAPPAELPGTAFDVPAAPQGDAGQSAFAAPQADESDPRLAALGLGGQAAATEAPGAADWATPTAADAGSSSAMPGEPFDTNTEDSSAESPAARLAGLVPSSEHPANGRTTEGGPQPTQIVVTGLLSVASIASFKRHLARVDGVHNVGVSSGPDGEFIFKTTHEPGVQLAEVIPTLPGFGAQITDSTEGRITVTAHDPESEA